MRIVGVAIGAIVLGIALFEIAMQPTGSDRIELLGILLAMVLVSALGAWLLPHWARRATARRHQSILPPQYSHRLPLRDDPTTLLTRDRAAALHPATGIQF